jgi:hypothetical protein
LYFSQRSILGTTIGDPHDFAELLALVEPRTGDRRSTRCGLWPRSARLATACRSSPRPPVSRQHHVQRKEDTTIDPQLAPLAVLCGEWITEATHPQVNAVVPGSATFEWLEGGHFMIQRSHHDHELFPDSLWVFGAPEAGEGLVMEGFDSRGVRRTYRVSLDDSVLSMWRDSPNFDQRFSAKLDHDAFEGLWQLAETPGDWQDDLKVIYRRRD